MATLPLNSSQIVRDQVSPEEWQTRIDLACAYRLIAHNGWDDLIFTHLSARVPGPDKHFLINPLGLMFEEITASSLVKVDLAGKTILPSPYVINPAGFIIHSCIHAARHDVEAVFHTHTVAGIAVSAQKNGLLPISQTVLQIYDRVGYHDYEGIALNADEQPRLVANLGDKNILILRNHGLLSAGETIGQTFLIHFLLEKACAIQVAAQSNGTDLQGAPHSMAELVAHQAEMAFSMGATLTWQALLRKMDRLDSGFRA